jgi:two-component system sensor histidine kinase KdpD
LIRFAEAENASQLVLGASQRSRTAELLRGSVINRVIRASGPIDIHVISTDEAESADAPGMRVPIRRAPALPTRRVVTAWVLAVLAPPLLALLLTAMRGTLTLPGDLLLFLFLVVVVAAIGGLLPALVAAVSGSLLANYYFTPPLHTFTISEGENLLALFVFIVVAAVVSYLVSVASRRSAEAARARAEAETLAALGGTLVGADDPLPQLVAQLRTAFSAESVAVLREEDGEWNVEASDGTPAPRRPEGATLRVTLGAHEVLVVNGEGLTDSDLDVLREFAAQVQLALESRRLRARVEAAAGLAEANELRTALLAAVSHDLRTPLASIKASVTSLLQRDVAWTPEATTEFLSTIDEETDRLNSLVGNLLDMSRLQTGVVNLVVREVGYDEVAPRALAGLPENPIPVLVAVPETLPRVRADAALLERAVANLVDNARSWSPPECSVLVEAGAVKDRVDLRVIDHGPGIPVDQREEVFRPFQRLGDNPRHGSGVGLGLAVAKGFVEVMGGEITVDDTPGGGATIVISLPAVHP